jgi:hypothetical protein
MFRLRWFEGFPSEIANDMPHPEEALFSFFCINNELLGQERRCWDPGRSISHGWEGLASLDRPLPLMFLAVAELCMKK